MNLKEYLNRFRNVGTLISTVSLIGLLMAQFGMDIDTVWLDQTAKLVCSLGVVMGIMNNPDTPKLDLPMIQSKNKTK